MKLRLPTQLTLVVLFLILGVSAGVAQSRGTIVTATRANLRETPSQNGEVKQEVSVGSEIKVLDRKGAWYVVRISDAVGWMHGNTFRFESSSTAEGTQPPLIEPPSGSTDTSRPPVRIRAESPSSPSSGASRGYIRGPRGGCYYYSSSGRKVYVDRSLCN